MRSLALASILLLPLSLACAGDDGGGGDGEGDDTADGGDGGSGDGGDGGSTVTCPDEVPEQYQLLWDCGATTCDGDARMYHHGIGESLPNGDIEIEEKWYWFMGEGDYCIDTFTITGEEEVPAFSEDPCSTCELSYHVWWELTESNCNIDYENFFESKDLDKQEYEGYLLFDTHTTLTEERNEDDVVLLLAIVREHGTNNYYLWNNYGKGTATPLDSAIDGPPEAYDWVNLAGDCIGTAR